MIALSASRKNQTRRLDAAFSQVGIAYNFPEAFISPEHEEQCKNKPGHHADRMHIVAVAPSELFVWADGQLLR